jgi:hypothetical protein
MGADDFIRRSKCSPFNGCSAAGLFNVGSLVRINRRLWRSTAWSVNKRFWGNDTWREVGLSCPRCVIIQIRKRLPIPLIRRFALRLLGHPLRRLRPRARVCWLARRPIGVVVVRQQHQPLRHRLRECGNPIGRAGNVGSGEQSAGHSRANRCVKRAPLRQIRVDVVAVLRSTLKPEKRAVWDIVGRVLCSPALRGAFVRRLAPSLQRRFGSRCANVGMFRSILAQPLSAARHRPRVARG